MGYKRLQGATRGYRGLLEDTESYKELKEVTNRGLQRVTRNYRRLKGVTAGCKAVTRGYRRFLEVTRC